MVGWIYCLIHNVFRSGSGGDRNAPARHSEASNKKIFQTEIDFDVWSRLPLGAAIQKMQLGSKIFRRYQENDVYRIFNVNIIRIYTYIYICICIYIYIKFLINLYIYINITQIINNEKIHILFYEKRTYIYSINFRKHVLSKCR